MIEQNKKKKIRNKAEKDYKKAMHHWQQFRLSQHQWNLKTPTFFHNFFSRFVQIYMRWMYAFFYNRKCQTENTNTNNCNSNSISSNTRQRSTDAYLIKREKCGTIQWDVRVKIPILCLQYTRRTVDLFPWHNDSQYHCHKIKCACVSNLWKQNVCMHFTFDQVAYGSFAIFFYHVHCVHLLRILLLCNK